MKFSKKTVNAYSPGLQTKCCWDFVEYMSSRFWEFFFYKDLQQFASVS